MLGKKLNACEISAFNPLIVVIDELAYRPCRPFIFSHMQSPLLESARIFAIPSAPGTPLEFAQCQQTLKEESLLPGIKAALEGPPKHPLAELLHPAHPASVCLPRIEGLAHMLVPDPASNGSAGLVAVVEPRPGLPGGGHRMVLQP